MSRSAFVALACATLLLGLWVHRGGLPMGASARDFTGDLLWATMLAWWIGAIAPQASQSRRGVTALGLCFAVELSQLVHTPAFDALRATTLGRLTLGSGFDPRDLVAYTVGVVVALVVERIAAT